MLYEHASKSDDGDVVELSELSLFSTLYIALNTSQIKLHLHINII